MDNNTVTITIDRFEKLVRDSQKLAVITQTIKKGLWTSSDIQALAAAMEGGNENA